MTEIGGLQTGRFQGLTCDSCRRSAWPAFPKGSEIEKQPAR
jgi:hypothetical protein